MKHYLALLLPIPLIPQIPSPVEVSILCFSDWFTVSSKSWFDFSDDKVTLSANCAYLALSLKYTVCWPSLFCVFASTVSQFGISH